MPKKSADVIQTKGDDSDNESIESVTDDLIQQLVDKYSCAKGDVDSCVMEEMTENDPPVPPDRVRKKKREATEKQKAHLEKTREIALQKRRKYAARRKEEKAEAERAAYEAEVAKRADEKIKEKITRAVSQQNRKRKIEIPEPEVKKAKQVKKVKNVAIVEESDVSSTDEESEEVVMRRKPVSLNRKATPVPKQRRKPASEKHLLHPLPLHLMDTDIVYGTIISLGERFQLCGSHQK